MRLDKYISNNTDISRSSVRKLAKAERITLNGSFIKDPSQKIQIGKDRIEIDGQPIDELGTVYLMLHKPEGYICANHDGAHPTVIDLIANPNQCTDSKNTPIPIGILDALQIVGRLDIDTTGLVLLTNDGAWNHRVTSPNSDCVKTYCVSLEHALEDNVEEKFAKGLLLEGEKKRTKPATLQQISETEVKLSISEGKYHQVKRMFAAVGNHVAKLHRESVGNIVLDDNLEPGQYRWLNDAEIQQFKPTE